MVSRKPKRDETERRISAATILDCLCPRIQPGVAFHGPAKKEMGAIIKQVHRSVVLWKQHTAQTHHNKQDTKAVWQKAA